MRFPSLACLALLSFGAALAEAEPVNRALWEELARQLPARSIEPRVHQGKILCAGEAVRGITARDPAGQSDDPSFRHELARMDSGFYPLLAERQRALTAYLGSLEEQRRRILERGEVALSGFERSLPRLRVAYQRAERLGCRLQAYRDRARQLTPLRAAARNTYERAASALAAAESEAADHCLDQPPGSRGQQDCLLAASLERNDLRRAMERAREIWEQISKPPDYSATEPLPERLTIEQARSRYQAALRETAYLPRLVGGEVWCGPRRVRGASEQFSPAVEFTNLLYSQGQQEKEQHRLQQLHGERRARDRGWIEEARGGVPRRELARRINRVRQDLEMLAAAECRKTWRDRRLRELAWVPGIFEAEWRLAEAIYQEVKTRCDALEPTPAPGAEGWVRGEDAEAWIDCLRARRKEHNDKLRLLKQARARWSMIEETLRSPQRPLTEAEEAPH